jgi:predicted sulfurtransferase
MLQLCYASRRVDIGHDLLQDLSDILSAARQFNEQLGVVGVLYYAEGQFFQCLEGDDDAVQKVFERIEKDPRHEHIHLFLNKKIKKQNFAEWSMKYVHKHSEIASLFERNGLPRFMPSHLNDEQLQELLKILFRVEENQEKLASPKIGYKNRGYIPYL